MLPNGEIAMKGSYICTILNSSYSALYDSEVQQGGVNYALDWKSDWILDSHLMQTSSTIMVK